MENTIIITVEGGVIQDIHEIPPGCTVVVMDYDINGIEDEAQLRLDTHGNAYVHSEWCGPSAP